jgi:hypothetical protein
MLDAVRDKFAGVIGTLFTTSTPGRALWDAWLAGIPEQERRQHDCRACRAFVERFGGLVTIDSSGVAHPAMFDDEAPSIYDKAFQYVHQAVRRARVTGVHVSSETTWGLPANTDKKRGRTWQHMHVLPPSSMLHRGAVLSASQRAAELHEDHGSLMRAMSEFSAYYVGQALSIAETDALYRGEKVAGRLRWLANLYERRGTLSQRAWSNVAWLAVATAPAGFCHVRSSVIGSLLEDLQAGKPFDEVRRSFDAKMHPLQYQRPTAPPSAGNIAQAEAVVAKMGIAASLRRRFARLEDLTTIWEPRVPEVRETEGVFGHLLEQRSAAALAASGPTITWEKFARTVLPGAHEIAVLAPARGHYTAFVTAADPEAPPIIQWDRPQQRNPVTWYTYSQGSAASQWLLAAGSWVPVTGVSEMPNMWAGSHEHHGKGVMLVLQGCRDTVNFGACLFPEFLRSDLHSVRATIEAHSNRMKLEDADLATACGITVRAGSKSGGVRVKVISPGVVTEYTIDRWD